LFQKKKKKAEETKRKRDHRDSKKNFPRPLEGKIRAPQVKEKGKKKTGKKKKKANIKR